MKSLLHRFWGLTTFVLSLVCVCAISLYSPTSGQNIRVATPTSDAGDLDTTFGAADGRVVANVSNSAVRKTLIQPDGKIIVICAVNFGNFTLIRYNPDGSMDPTFDGDGLVSTQFGIQDSRSGSAVLQDDGKIIVVGEARETNPSGSDFAIIRYSSNGSIDSTFGSGGKVFTSFTSTSQDYANDVALQSDGKIVVSGNTSDGGFGVARYNTDGSLDPSFGANGKTTIAVANNTNSNYAVAIQNDGKILLGGSVVISNPPQPAQYMIGIARLNQNGSPDPSFDGDGKVTTPFGTYVNCSAIKLQPDGKIIAVGAVSITGSLDFALVRYNVDGSLDGQFGSSGKVSTSLGEFDDNARSVTLQPDGKIVVAGDTRINSEDTDFAIVRYDQNGNLDPNFGFSGKVVMPVGVLDSAGSLALQTDGKIVTGGSAAALAAPSLIAVVRLDQNGIIDQTFGFQVPGRATTVVRGVIDEANAVVIQPDGKIVSVGRSRLTNRFSFSVSRQNPNGTLDATFGNNGTLSTKIGVGDTDAEAYAVALQPDGKIIAAGRIYDANNFNQSLYYFAVARYDSNGSLDATFDQDGIRIIPAPNEDNRAYSVAVQADGKILLAGYNDSVAGTSSNYDLSVVRLNQNGELDPTFDGDGVVTTDLGGTNDVAYSIKLQPDGKIVVGGGGRGPNFFQNFALVRYNPDGSLDSSFGTGGKVLEAVGASSNEVRSLAIQSDGKIVVAGFNGVGTQRDFSVARFNSNGTLDLNFGNAGKIITPIEASSEDTASGMVLQSDGKIIVVGTTVRTNNSNLAVVRYLSNGSLDTDFGGSGIVITDYSSLGNSGETAVAADIQLGGKLIVVGGMRNQTIQGLSNTRRDFLSVRYHTVSAPAGFEADVAPRQSGDGSVLSTDITQVRRFVSGLDTPSLSPNEFQRTDSAPRVSLGDGIINSSDVVQARRYGSGLDPLSNAGGPTVSADPPLRASIGGSLFGVKIGNKLDQEALLRLEVGKDGSMVVVLESRAEVSAVSFGLRYDPALGQPLVSAGELADGAVLTLNNTVAGELTVLIDSAGPLGYSGKTLRLVSVGFENNVADGSIEFDGVASLSDAMGNAVLVELGA
ncbi:MAG: hypothetical protein ABL959_06390 [Pyrinomonadaceae bacterium]